MFSMKQVVTTMAFDFDSIEGLDEDTKKALSENGAIKDAISAHIEEATNNRVEVAKSQFKTKMDAMDAKVKLAQESASAFEGVNPDELATLKAARDSSSELQGTLDKLKESYAQKEAELSEQTAKIQGMQVEQVVNQSVNEYNSKYNDAWSLKSDAIPLASMLLKQAVSLDGDSVKVVRNGEILVTDKGAGTPVDFIETLREVHPSMFNQPTGSGAKGSTASSGAKQITREEFNRLPPQKQVEAARTLDITE